MLASRYQASDNWWLAYGCVLARQSCWSHETQALYIYRLANYGYRSLFAPVQGEHTGSSQLRLYRDYTDYIENRVYVLFAVVRLQQLLAAMTAFAPGH